MRSHPGAELVQRLASLPPLAMPAETRALREAIAAAGRGERFLLHARLGGARATRLQAGLRLLTLVRTVLAFGSGRPVSTVVCLSPPTGADPLPAYHNAAAVLSFLRASGQEERDDLAVTQAWGQALPARSDALAGVVTEIDRALAFMTACGLDVRAATSSLRHRLYAATELSSPTTAAALIRTDARDRNRYATSAHLLWLAPWASERSIRVAAKAANPVGVRLGRTVTPRHLTTLCGQVDPHRSPGRLVLLVALDTTAALLGRLCEAVHGAGHAPVWGYVWGGASGGGGDVATLRGTLLRHGAELGGVAMDLDGRCLERAVGIAAELMERPPRGRSPLREGSRG